MFLTANYILNDAIDLLDAQISINKRSTTENNFFIHSVTQQMPKGDFRCDLIFLC